MMTMLENTGHFRRMSHLSQPRMIWPLIHASLAHGALGGSRKTAWGSKLSIIVLTDEQVAEND